MQSIKFLLVLVSFDVSLHVLGFITDRTYSGLHLPPLDWKPLTDKNYIGVNLTPAENFEKNLPNIEELEVLYRKLETKYAPNLLSFPLFCQWFTDSFLQTERQNHLKNNSNHQIGLCTVYGLNPKITHLLRAYQG